MTSSRRPRGVGAPEAPTGPNVVSAFHRRPLGSGLPLPDRAAALEARIRELYAGVDELAAAIEALDTGRDSDTGQEVSPAMAWRRIHQAAVDLQEIRAYGIRALKRRPRP